jgi:hypothetical protein
VSLVVLTSAPLRLADEPADVGQSEGRVVEAAGQLFDRYQHHPGSIARTAV